MNDSFKNVLFDKMLRLTYPYSLLYRDLLLFTLYFVIFHCQIHLLIIWYLTVVYFQFKCKCFLVIIITQKKKFFLPNFFKCIYIIVRDYFLFNAGRLFKYLFLGIFIIYKHFLKLLLIIFVVNFAFINIIYINYVSFDTYNVKPINVTFSLTVLTEDISNYVQEVLISVSATPEKIKSLNYILWNYLTLTIISFCASIFCKNSFLWFCKAPNKSIDFYLKSSRINKCFSRT